MPLRSIDVNLVVPLRALLRERNVTRAGRAVGLGQSSMSHALARLRAHFDDALLVPNRRTLVLTERAKALVPLVEAAAERLEQVFSPRPTFDPRTSERVVRLVGTDNLALYLLPALTRLLAREAPRVTVRFVSLTSAWADALRSGEADLKLGRRYPLEGGLHDEPLLEERLVCVMRKGHPATKKKLGTRAYAALAHVAVAPTETAGDAYRSTIDDRLADLGLRRRIALTVPHFVVAPIVVARSDLVLTAAERLAHKLAKPLGLAVVEAPVPLSRYELSLVWADRAAGDEALVWLRGAIRRALEEDERR